MAQEGNILEFSNLTLKAMGDTAQWQCSDLDVYGSLQSSAKVEQVADDGTCPQNVHMVLLRHLPFYTKIPYKINVAGILIDAQVPTSTKASAPAFNLILADGDQSV